MDTVAVIGRDQIGRTAAAAARAGGRLRRLLPGSAAPSLVEIALTGVLAALLALTALKLAAPLPVPKAPAIPAPAATAGPVAAKNPFTLADAAPIEAGPAAPVAAETTLDLALHGTWVDPERGAAIIRTPDGKQDTFVVGDVVCCGATLEGVYPDQVIIARAGVRESLRLPNKREAAPHPRADAPEPVERAPAESRALSDIQSISRAVRFRPAPQGSGGARLALHAAGDKRAFEELGFREGDILVSVNGAPAPSGLDGVSQLLSTLAGVSSVVIGVERNGAPTNVEISLAPES